jgi:hypothetical protein
VLFKLTGGQIIPSLQKRNLTEKVSAEKGNQRDDQKATSAMIVFFNPNLKRRLTRH